MIASTWIQHNTEPSRGKPIAEKTFISKSANDIHVMIRTNSCFLKRGNTREVAITAQEHRQERRDIRMMKSSYLIIASVKIKPTNSSTTNFQKRVKEK